MDPGVRHRAHPLAFTPDVLGYLSPGQSRDYSHATAKEKENEIHF